MKIDEIATYSILPTQIVSNLVSKFSDKVPISVLLRAEEIAEPFLCEEMIRKKTWESFIRDFKPESETAEITTYVLPLVFLKDNDYFVQSIDEAVTLFIKSISLAGENYFFWKDNTNIVVDAVKGGRLLAWQS